MHTFYLKIFYSGPFFTTEFNPILFNMTRARKDYWQNLNPATGRPHSAAFSKPDNWGVTAGSEDLKQKAESTTKEELQKVFARSAK